MKLHTPRTYWRLLWRRIRPFSYHPEPLVFNLLQKIKGMVFVDVGANVGAYAIPLSKNFQKTYAIEPNPNTLPQLAKNIGLKRLSRIEIMDCALSNKDGMTFLYVDQVEHRPNQALGSADTVLPEFDYRPISHPEINRTFKGQKGFKVASQRFDRCFTKADLVKIDVEGAEFLVLEGMAQSLSKHNIRHIMVELHNRDRKQELEELFRYYGYSWRWVDQDHFFATL